MKAAIITLFIMLQQTFQQQCQTNNTLGTQVFPTVGNPYALPLANYFTGQGLVFSISSQTAQTSKFTVSQFVATQIQAQTTFKGATALIDSTQQNLYSDPNVQTGLYAVLASSTSGYMIFQGTLAQVGGKIIWTQIGTITTGVTCYNIAYIFSAQLIVSCVAPTTNIQVFYYFDPTITTTSQPGLVINTPTTLPAPAGVVYSKLQVLQTVQDIKTQDTQIIQVFTVPKSKTSTIVGYSVSLNEGNLKNPITLVQKYQKSEESVYGSYVANDGSVFLLTSTQLIYTPYTTKTPAPLTYSIPKQTFISLGVYEIFGIGGSVQFYVSLATPTGVINLNVNPAATNVFVPQSQGVMPFPLGATYSSTITYQMFVNPFYVVYSTGINIVVYPGYVNQDSTQFIYTQTLKVNSVIGFDVRSSLLTIVQLTQYQTVQLNRPYLAVDKLGATQNGYVNVTATSFNGTICTMTFNYMSVTQASPPQPTLNAAPPIPKYKYPQSTVQELSPFFYGPNMTYAATATPALNDQTINQATIKSYTQSATTKITYSQVFANPNSQTGYALVTQISDQLGIAFCKADYCGGSKAEAVITVKNPVAVAAVGQSASSTTFYLAAITTTTPTVINVYNIKWGQANQKVGNPTVIDVTKQVPTMTVVDFEFLENILYVVTATPQSVIAYNSTNFNVIYTLQGQNITPRQIFTNYQSYGTLVFVDNTFELLIFQTVYNSSQIVQTIQYTLQDGASTAGIGLLNSGIYIAQTDGTNQQIYFYPRLATNPYQFTTLQQIPLTYQFTAKQTLANPVVSSFSNYKFYVGWTAPDGTTQIGALQASSGSFNMLYYSQYVNGATISQLSSVGVLDTYSFDIVNVLTNTAETVYQLQNITYSVITPSFFKGLSQNYEIDYTVSGNATPVSMTITYLDSSAYIDVSDETDPSRLTRESKAFGLLTISPDEYFVGIIKNYSAIGFTSSGSTIPLQVLQPITTSNVVGNITFQAAASGFNNTPGYTYVQDVYSVYYYTPLIEKGQYLLSYNFNQSTILTKIGFATCPLLFVDYQFEVDNTVSVCTNSIDSYIVYYNTSNAVITVQSFTDLTGVAVPNLIDALYSNSFLVLYSETQVVFNWVTFPNGGICLYFLSQTTLDKPFVTAQLIEIVSNNDGVTTAGIVAVEAGNQVVLIAGEFNNLNIGKCPGAGKTTTIDVSEYNIDLDPVISAQYGTIAIYQYAASTVTADSIAIPLIIQTDMEGFYYQLSYTTGAGSLGAKLLYTLESIVGFTCVDFQVNNGMVVGEYFNVDSGQTVIGIYGAPDIPTGSLYFVGYYDQFTSTAVPPTPPTEFTLTQNGTLLYNIDNSFSQLYVMNDVYVYANLSQFSQTAGQFLITMNLTASNDYSNVTQQFKIQAFSDQFTSFNKPSGEKWWYVGFGCLGAAIVIAVLAFLCYTARPQSQGYYADGIEV